MTKDDNWVYDGLEQGTAYLVESSRRLSAALIDPLEIIDARILLVSSATLVIRDLAFMTDCSIDKLVGSLNRHSSPSQQLASSSFASSLLPPASAYIKGNDAYYTVPL